MCFKALTLVYQKEDKRWESDESVDLRKNLRIVT